MTLVEKKLLSLNLALFFLFLCAQPAFAAGTEQADRTELLQSEASVAVGETLQLQEENEAATQSTSEDDSYYICVGDTSFQSNKDTSGDGWTMWQSCTSYSSMDIEDMEFRRAETLVYM